jgi:hypothetical protein
MEGRTTEPRGVPVLQREVSDYQIPLLVSGFVKDETKRGAPKGRNKKRRVPAGVATAPRSTAERCLVQRDIGLAKLFAVG